MKLKQWLTIAALAAILIGIGMAIGYVVSIIGNL